MILDTSALVAIFFGEPEQADFTEKIYLSSKCSLSVASFLEISMVVERQLGPDASRQVESFIRRAGITLEPVTIEQAYLARQAFLDFGKGRHPAGLNFGDCFSYALAKALGESLLFKGQDFRLTDVKCA